MSVSRVRENRMHGSMRRREATKTSRASTRRAAAEASRRPYRTSRLRRWTPEARAGCCIPVRSSSLLSGGRGSLVRQQGARSCARGTTAASGHGRHDRCRGRNALEREVRDHAGKGAPSAQTRRGDWSSGHVRTLISDTAQSGDRISRACAERNLPSRRCFEGGLGMCALAPGNAGGSDVVGFAGSFSISAARRGSGCDLRVRERIRACERA
jgi:hypothetical protein